MSVVTVDQVPDPDMRLVAEDLSPRQRVELGGAWLDERDPGWWREGNLDLTDLDMRSCTRCLLGQLFGRYSHGPEADLSDEQVILLGFNASWSALADLSSQYEALEVAWRELVVARRAAAAGGGL